MSEEEVPELPPPQDPEEIREIRRGYRAELAELELNRQTLTHQNNQELHKHLKTVDKLYARVQRTQEAVLDSKAIKVIADYAAEKAEKLRTNTNQFDIGDFLKNVLSKLGHAEEVDMRRAGQLAFRFTLKPPTVGFLLGPLELKPKEKKEAVKRQKREKVDQVEVKEIPTEELSKQATLETTKLVNSVHKHLQKAVAENGGPVDLIKFVTNPDQARGFSQTAENIFYLSFLVRDDLVSWSFGDDGLLYVEPLGQIQEGYEAENQKAAKQGKRQLVLNLSYQNWKDAVTLYEVTSPMIPDRPAVPEAAPSWHG